MRARRAVDVVVPAGIDDPLRPSGGNSYDRRVCDGLVSCGWAVRVREVAGAWPWAGERGRRELKGALAELPDHALVLMDGLVASAVPEVVLRESRRLRLVVLLHMPVGAPARGAVAGRRERLGLSAAAAVVVTSEWSRTWLLTAYGLEPGRVHVARPGVDGAQPTVGGADGGRLLCVGAVTPAKGQDLLLAALSSVADRGWRCRCVGSRALDPAFVARLRRDALAGGLRGRFVLLGPRTGRQLERAYAGADALVLASRAETYGMVVTEALARGVPVLATAVGGVPEALGVTSGGERPGLLTPPGDVGALSEALRCWLDDEALRAGLRAAARARRRSLPGWAATVDRVAGVLEDVAA